MRKELLSQFEELELFAENVEKAVEAARLKTQYPVDLRFYVGEGQYDIYETPTTIEHYVELLRDIKQKFLERKKWRTAHLSPWRDEMFIDLYENTPAEAVYCGVTIWLSYFEGQVFSNIDC